MRRHRTVKATLVVAAIAAAVAVPVGTASAAAVRPMVHTSVDEGAFPSLSVCNSNGGAYLAQGADSYNCLSNGNGTYELWTYWS
ncbi:hypothetical protein [Catenulispora pinisilvae]|uniref:hypothetical protein n=1 Tax=Catenulispora pinisilvae TaxID=2705253 RepID=UPI001890BCBE|nr:hypothetical protein [Catenulispora pinisilvae]